MAPQIVSELFRRVARLDVYRGYEVRVLASYYEVVGDKAYDLLRSAGAGAAVPLPVRAGGDGFEVRERGDGPTPCT